MLFRELSAQQFDFEGSVHELLSQLSAWAENVLAEEERMLFGAMLLVRGKASLERLAFQDSLLRLDTALKIAQGLSVNPEVTKLKLMIHVALANAFRYLTQYEDAFEHDSKALGFAEHMEDREWQGRILTNMGITLVYTEDYERGSDFIRQAIEMFQELQQLEGVGRGYFNLGWCASQHNDHEDAARHYRNSLRIFEQIDDHEGIVYNHYAIGKAYYHSGDINTALSHAVIAYRMKKAVRMPTFDLQIHLLLGMIQWRYPLEWSYYTRSLDARDYLEVGFAEAERSDARQYREDYLEELAERSRTAGESDKAIIYFRKLVETVRDQAAQSFTRTLTNTRLAHQAEQAHAEAEIHRLKSVELGRVNLRLEESVRKKDELLQILAHDLNNPLANIYSAIEMIQSMGQDLPVQNLQKMLGYMHQSAETALKLIRRLLDSQALEAGRYELNIRGLDLRSPIRAALKDQIHRARKKGILLEVELPDRDAVCPIDPTAVEQVLINLISNGIKFSQPGSRVLVSLHCADGVAQIAVADQGPGLSEEDQKRLFQPFTRLSAKPTGGEPSTGLGLSIVHNLVNAMNGTIQCQSELGVGTTFHIAFQLEQPVDVTAG